jgi:hypothetical protein
MSYLNKETTVAKKRASGGGRKPTGLPVARPLTIRIDDELREKLEMAARKRARHKSRWNLSQEILHRLKRSLKDRDQSDPMRALCFLISEMARRELESGPGEPSWHRDPFTFRALKLAIASLLDALEPPGDAHPPETLPLHQSYLRGPLRTPELLAEHMTSRTLNWLYQEPIAKEDLARLRGEIRRSPFHGTEYDPITLIEDAEMDDYALSDARRDLQLPQPSERKVKGEKS